MSGIWTEMVDATLMRLIDDDALSYAEIANELSLRFGVRVNRNACIGRARRLKRIKRGAPPERWSRYPKIKNAPVPAVRKRAVPPPALYPTLVTLLELERHQCKWTDSDNSPWLFCAAPVEDGQVYCNRHCCMAYYGHKAA